MCRDGDKANSNECMFYVTTGSPLHFLDNKNVVFGRVISGLRTFKMIEKVETVNEKPTQAITITGCGVYKK
jgi:cyclophilin family peptidyl-prolyl cis-trans isomerase